METATSIAQGKDGEQKLPYRMILDATNRITPDELRNWIDRFEYAQHPEEFDWFLDRIENARSFLEIGSRFGATLYRTAKRLKPGARFMAVDLPNADDNVLDSERTLQARCNEINAMGHQCGVIFGDSHDQRVIERVRQNGPYDVCFIDGDHTELGVWQDWENYGPMAQVVGFHDIAVPHPCYVSPLWEQLKKKYLTLEYQSQKEWAGMGIGIVYRESYEG